MKFRLSSSALVEEATLELKRVGFDVRPPRDGAPDTLKVKGKDEGTVVKVERIVLFVDPAAKRVDS